VSRRDFSSDMVHQDSVSSSPCSPQWEQHINDGGDEDSDDGCCSNNSDCSESGSQDCLEEYYHEDTPSHAMPYMLNKYRCVVHDYKTIHTMLRGLKNVNGQISAHTMNLLDLRMKRRDLWKFSTQFRISTYELRELQITHCKSKGMDQTQALGIQNSMKSHDASVFDIRSLLLSGSPNYVREDEGNLKELTSTLLWNQEHEKLVHTVQRTPEYRSALQTISPEDLNAAGYLPRPLFNTQTPDHMLIFMNIIGVGVAVRMMRDNVSAQSAVELLLKAKILDAVFFFG